MLFDIKQFEQFFKEKTLKKGLGLFEKNELEFVEKQAGLDYYFLVSGANVLLKKRGDKLISYTCSCKNNSYCEHLSAAMFYFQQEALGIQIKKRKVSKQVLKGPYKRVMSALDVTLEKIENESLVKFIREHKQNLFAGDILSFLSDKSTLTLFDVYCLQIELILEPYLFLKKVDQKDSELLRDEIQDLLKKTKKHVHNQKDLFYLDLAIVKTFIPLFYIRITGNEKLIFSFYDKAIERLDEAYGKGLSSKEKNAWFRAAVASVESNKSLHCDAFTFLIPRFVCTSKNEAELLFLNNKLRKRIYKIPYSHTFDKLLIVRFEVALREWKLFKTALPLHAEYGEVELIIAKSELYFCNNGDDKAFRLLELNYEEIRTLHKRYYNDYLEYIISQARKKEKVEIEIKYLRENFIRRLFSLPEKFERYLELLPVKDHSRVMEELVTLIKSKREYYSFDKLVVLLMRNNRIDDLIEEIKKQDNKFSLLQDLLLRKLPEFNERQLALYVKQLMETLTERKMNVYQEQLIDKSKEFIDLLPIKVKQKVVGQILDKLGGQSGLHRYIMQVYDYNFED